MELVASEELRSKAYESLRKSALAATLTRDDLRTSCAQVVAPSVNRHKLEM